MSRRTDAADYEIRITGHLDPRWTAMFDGLSLRQEPGGTTVISGRVVDQAALHGLLQQIRDLGVPLVCVTRLGPDTPASGASGPAEAEEGRNSPR